MGEILQAATKLFSEKGFLGTTTQELADAVGLVKGTLYYHIGSKDELLYRIHQQVTKAGIDRWNAILEGAEDAPVVDVLARMVDEHCALTAEYREWIAVFSEELKFLAPDYRERVREQRAEYQSMLESVIQRGVDRGELATDDVHVMGLVIMGTLNSIYRWYSPGGRISTRKLGAITTSILLDGLAA